MDLNHGPLVSKVTAIPTEAQLVLPRRLFNFISNFFFTVHMHFGLEQKWISWIPKILFTFWCNNINTRNIEPTAQKGKKINTKLWLLAWQNLVRDVDYRWRHCRRWFTGFVRNIRATVPQRHLPPKRKYFFWKKFFKNGQCQPLFVFFVLFKSHNQI